MCLVNLVLLLYKRLNEHVIVFIKLCILTF